MEGNKVWFWSKNVSHVSQTELWETDTKVKAKSVDYFIWTNSFHILRNILFFFSYSRFVDLPFINKYNKRFRVLAYFIHNLNFTEAGDTPKNDKSHNALSTWYAIPLISHTPQCVFASTAHTCPDTPGEDHSIPLSKRSPGLEVCPPDGSVEICVSSRGPTHSR